MEARWQATDSPEALVLVHSPVRERSRAVRPRVEDERRANDGLLGDAAELSLDRAGGVVRAQRQARRVQAAVGDAVVPAELGLGDHAGALAGVLVSAPVLGGDALRVGFVPVVLGLGPLALLVGDPVRHVGWQEGFP